MTDRSTNSANSGDDGIAIKHRRRGRELAFQALYGMDFHDHGAPDAPSDAMRTRIMDTAWQEAIATIAGADSFKPISDEALLFGRDLFQAAAKAIPKTDAKIAAISAHWKLSRIGKVELAILRLAAHELASQDAPARVVLNEAIELAKTYGDENSPAFINGVLDALAKGR